MMAKLFKILTGFKVNEVENEMYLFHRKDQPSTTIKLLGLTIKTQKERNVLTAYLIRAHVWPMPLKIKQNTLCNKIYQVIFY
jgi:hypothetical protein